LGDNIKTEPGLTWAYLINEKIKLKFSEFTDDGEFVGELSEYQLLKQDSAPQEQSCQALYRYLNLQNTHKQLSPPLTLLSLLTKRYGGSVQAALPTKPEMVATSIEFYFHISSSSSSIPLLPS
jgi:hypothetical protein